MLSRRGWLMAGLAGLLLAGTVGAGRAQNFDLLPNGSKAPDFALTSVDGKPLKLSEMNKDRVVLVNFFFNG
ncbi:MAG TPA: hypothetical protein VFU47_05140 [Armatimonadota bacterium]|nr:hypothetical protein [Armatimonadota bacterium]